MKNIFSDGMVEDCQIKNLDIIYNKYFENKTNGVFVEVGAFDGISYSNSSPLVKCGWKGIYIEPVKEYFERLHNNLGHNKNLTLLNCAISDTEEEKNINVMETLSTLNDNMIPIYENIDWAIPSTKILKKEKITCKKLTTVLDENLMDQNIDVLIIDVEGYELNVLNSLDFNKYSPNMIIIELEDNHESFQTDNCKELRENIESCRNILDTNYYKLIFSDNINSIYILKK